MARKTARLVSLGCAKNLVDAERLARQMRANGYEVSADATERQDAIIINTCGFIDDAKEESVNAILEACELKRRGDAEKVIVVGCLSQRYREELAKELPEADALFGVEAYEEIVGALGGDLKRELLGERDRLEGEPHTGYLKIAEGCDRACSFCAIPGIRGKQRSATIEELTAEARLLAERGVKELIVIAQDTTSYGVDLYGAKRLPDLLNRLAEVEGIEWLRLLYAHPAEIDDALIDIFANNSKLLKYLDAPIQHADDATLRAMRRNHSKRYAERVFGKLRDRVPDIVLRTTFLVGFPSETDEAFDELLEFAARVRFDRAGAFAYSPEEGTEAFATGDPISDETKRRRLDELMDLQRDISAERLANRVGETHTALVERRENDHLVARAYWDAPEIDGEILIPVETISTDRTPNAGEFVTVEITETNDFDAFAVFT
jgi:ribosomal protein S12 methylthiotransferase